MPRKKKEEKTEEEKKLAETRRNANLMDINALNASLTPEQRKQNASKAGKASQEKKRKNRMMMEVAQKILEMRVSENYTGNREIMRRFGIEEEDMTYAAAMLAMLAVKGMSGDVNAAKFVRDTAGMDSLTVLKEEQLEYMKENGQTINVNLDGQIEQDVVIYMPDNGRPIIKDGEE